MTRLLLLCSFVFLLLFFAVRLPKQLTNTSLIKATHLRFLDGISIAYQHRKLLPPRPTKPDEDFIQIRTCMPAVVMVNLRPHRKLRTRLRLIA